MRRLLPLLLSLMLPACRGIGAEGLPVPPPLAMDRLTRPSSPNTALAAPAGFNPTPDIVTKHYTVPPDQLYHAIRAVALAQPRTYPHAEYAAARQGHFVARSDWLNFPDLIAVQVTPESDLILWSRSVHGRSDFGVNRARLAAWLAALDAGLAAQR